MKGLLVTGGAGFIGSHLVRRLVHGYADSHHIVNLDRLTYAGNLANLDDLKACKNYELVRGDICDGELVDSLFTRYQFTAVFHAAAESHVDRSIRDPLEFVRTNVLGTTTLLQVAHRHWQADTGGRCFLQVSTDEVYGALQDEDPPFQESTPLQPRSPYAASKASADHLVRAFHHTYGLPVKISNCSNNYGPCQFPEKLIPLCILNLMQGKPLPVYGQGSNVRDWLYVEDHAVALDLIWQKGRPGETYNVGGDCERRNLEVVKALCRLMDEELGRAPGTSEQTIHFVSDRPGHDFRYAVDFSKIRQELGWQPSLSFEEGLRRTVRWYLDNPEWIAGVTSGTYQEYYQQQYGTVSSGA